MNDNDSAGFSVSELQLMLEGLKGAVREAMWQRSAILGLPRQNDWPEVFVLMPFTEALQPVYKNHIRKVAARLKVRVDRADHFIGTVSIMQDIWSAIHAARVIVADCTGKNPNVFYEIGLAHAIGKHTILISQSIDDIPFNLRHLRIIPYEYTPPGMKTFERNLCEYMRKSL